MWALGEGGLSSAPLVTGIADSTSRPANGLYAGFLDDDPTVDLFAMAGNPETGDYVLRGNGDGTFTIDAEAFPTSLSGGHGFDAQWFDHGDDFDLDLYVANDMGPLFGGNELGCNEAGTLVDAGGSTGCTPVTSGMGVEAADFNGDGLPDFLLTETARTTLLVGQADNSCIDVGQVAGLPAMTDVEMGWGGIFLDIDNDSDLDVFEARGDLWHDKTQTDRIYDTSSRLYVHEGDRLVDTTAAFGMDVQGSFRSAVAWDDNADGVLDLLVTDTVAAPHLFLSESCTTDSWIEVAAPLGARVEVEAGGRVQVAWVTEHSGMGGSRPLLVHFGLGEATEVERLVVTTVAGPAFAIEGPVTARRRFWTPDGPDPWLSRP